MGTEKKGTLVKGNCLSRKIVVNLNLDDNMMKTERSYNGHSLRPCVSKIYECEFDNSAQSLSISESNLKPIFQNALFKYFIVTIQLKVAPQYFLVVLFIMLDKEVLAFESVDETFNCDHLLFSIF